MAGTTHRQPSVFINCPFDPKYRDLFDALIFTVAFCDFNVRTALEIVDSGEARLTKIVRLIGDSALSIHDISRVELDRGLPRFNMPIELGIVLGAKHLGTKRHRRHQLLVLDGASHEERFRYQALASDLAGVDIRTHENSPQKLVEAVRDFLAPNSMLPLPGGSAVALGLSDFAAELPEMANRARQDAAKLSFVDRLRHLGSFLDRYQGDSA